MKQWHCNHCNFLTWGDSRQEVKTTIKTHLLSHHSRRLRKSEFRLSWDCPYCPANKTVYDKEEAIDDFKSHLCGHVEDRIKSGRHIADHFNWDGNVQLNARSNSSAADRIRTHFHSQADFVILITASPEERIRLLYDELSTWPERVIVLSTGGNPFDDTTELDFSGMQLELVELDSRLGPTDVGETLSRILDIHYSDDQRVSVEIDIMSEVISSFDLKTSCNFLQMLSSRLRTVDGTLQVYVNPGADQNIPTVLNFLDDEFDLTIDAIQRPFIRTN